MTSKSEIRTKPLWGCTIHLKTKGNGLTGMLCIGHCTFCFAAKNVCRRLEPIFDNIGIHYPRIHSAMNLRTKTSSADVQSLFHLEVLLDSVILQLWHSLSLQGMPTKSPLLFQFLCSISRSLVRAHGDISLEFTTRSGAPQGYHLSDFFPGFVTKLKKEIAYDYAVIVAEMFGQTRN